MTRADPGKLPVAASSRLDRCEATNEGSNGEKAEVVLIDDLDGSRAEETISFGLGGRHYEIDLSAANAKQLRSDLEAYVRQVRATPPPAPRHQAAVIRQWAMDNGYGVSARGRIHRDVIEAYTKAEQVERKCQLTLRKVQLVDITIFVGL